MAKESIDLPMSHEITKVDKDNSRRNSTGKPGSATKGDNVGPHYLRASTGSCHDVCKYGKQHTFETKPWRPLRRRSHTSQGGEHPVEILALDNKTKKTIKSNKLELSPAMKPPLPLESPSHDPSEPVQHEARLPISHASKASKSTDQEFPSLGESSSSDALQLTQQEASVCINSASPDALESINEHLVLHRKSSFPSVPEPNEGETLSFMEHVSADAAKSLKTEVPVTVESVSADASKSNKQEVSSSANLKVTPKKSSSNAKKTRKSGKPSGSLKSKHSPVRPVSSLNPSGGSSGKTNSDTKVQNDSGTSRVAVKKMLAASAASLSPKAKWTSKVAVETVLTSSTASLSPAMKSPLPLKSPSHDSSEPVKHEAWSRISHASVEASKSTDQEFPSLGESSFSDALQLAQQGASVCMNSASPDALESSNEHLVLRRNSSLANDSEANKGETVSFMEKASADAAKSLKEEVPVSLESVSAAASKSNKQEDPSSANRKVTPNKASSNAKETNKSGKPFGSLKPKHSTVRQVSSLNPSGGSGGKTHSDSKVQNDSKTSRVALRKILATPAVSMTPKAKRTSKVAVETASLSTKTSGRKAPNSMAKTNVTRSNESQKTEASHKRRYWVQKAETKKVGDRKVREKILHVIKVGMGRKSPGLAKNGGRIIKSPSPFSHGLLKSSPQPFSRSSSSHEPDDLYESGYTDVEGDEYISDHNDLKDRDKMRPKSTRKFYSKEENSAVAKLNFRRGKVVEPQSETSTPRRLIFRRGRVLDNKAVNGDPRRNGFRRRITDGNTDCSKAAEKVVLRHQDLQGKKIDQVLLNNVIEETASKLVETRKSKVKALVGAFETVISLQEGRQSADRPTEIVS